VKTFHTLQPLNHKEETRNKESTAPTKKKKWLDGSQKLNLAILSQEILYSLYILYFLFILYTFLPGLQY
jgi:hypothetical protein